MTKILLAEDDLFLRDIYAEIFSDEGFAVTTAVDGKETLEKLLKGGWDVLLLDIIMPKMNGLEVLQEIQKKPKNSFAKHIVLMTNSDEVNGIEDVIDIIDGHLLKSAFTPDKLVAEIKKYIAKG